MIVSRVRTLVDAFFFINLKSLFLLIGSPLLPRPNAWVYFALIEYKLKKNNISDILFFQEFSSKFAACREFHAAVISVQNLSINWNILQLVINIVFR